MNKEGVIQRQEPTQEPHHAVTRLPPTRQESVAFRREISRQACSQETGPKERPQKELRMTRGLMSSRVMECRRCHHPTSLTGQPCLFQNLLSESHRTNRQEQVDRREGDVPTDPVTCRTEVGKYAGTKRRAVPHGANSCAREIEGE